MYVSHQDSEDDWELRTDEGGVGIFVARPEILLAMKLYAGRGSRDADDIDRLIDACGIASVTAALELFDRYYPAEEIAAPAMRQLRHRFAPTTP